MVDVADRVPRLKATPEMTEAPGADERIPACVVSGLRLKSLILASPAPGCTYDAEIASIWSGSLGGQYLPGSAGS